MPFSLTGKSFPYPSILFPPRGAVGGGDHQIPLHQRARADEAVGVLGVVGLPHDGRHPAPDDGAGHLPAHGAVVYAGSLGVTGVTEKGQRDEKDDWLTD